MSKRQYFGTTFDQILLQPTNRSPAYRVEIWNPHRTDIHDVVMGQAESPAYDVSDWVASIGYNENIVFENNDDAVATSLTLEVVYDEDALPVEMTQRTWLDGTPIRVYQGDTRIPKTDWVPIFTGVCRGVPSTTELTRNENKPQRLMVTAVDRAEKYLNKLVTARSYDQGTDVGKAAIETAIEWGALDRREIKIGYQDYEIGHEQSQLVDIELLKGLYHILFTVGKKPRFNAEGYLVAADTDLERAPVREYPNKDLIVEISREQVLSSINNSVRLLGLANELTEVVEKDKRLAHGSITAGFFESAVRDWIYFSENDGKASGGRRAKDTYLANEKISTVGGFFGENLEWRPTLEDDGYTCFGGQIAFDTGFDATIRAVLTGTYAASWSVGAILDAGADMASAVGDISGATSLTTAANVAKGIAVAAMVGIILSMTEMGRVYWEVHGKPFQHVYQQLVATAALNGILTEDIHEIELRNDWLYDLDYMEARARELLKRELIKAWSYRIVMIDDPLIEADDIIQVEDLKFYVTSIRKTLTRPGDGRMILTAWRLA